MYQNEKIGAKLRKKAKFIVLSYTISPYRTVGTTCFTMEGVLDR